MNNSSIITNGGVKKAPTSKDSKIFQAGFGIQVLAEMPKIHDEILQNITSLSLKRGLTIKDNSRDH